MGDAVPVSETALAALANSATEWSRVNNVPGKVVLAVIGDGDVALCVPAAGLFSAWHSLKQGTADGAGDLLRALWPDIDAKTLKTIDLVWKIAHKAFGL